LPLLPASGAADGKDKAQPYQVINNPISWSSGPAAAAATNSSKFGAGAGVSSADGNAGGGWLHSSGMSHAEAIRQMSTGSGEGRCPSTLLL
jgi:hypothetical protein